MRSFQHLPSPDDFDRELESLFEAKSVFAKLESQLGQRASSYIERSGYSEVDNPSKLPCWPLVSRSVDELYPVKTTLLWKGAVNNYTKDEEFLIVPYTAADNQYLLRCDVIGSPIRAPSGGAQPRVPSHMVWMGPYESVSSPVALTHLEPGDEGGKAAESYMLSDGAWSEVICNLSTICAEVKEIGGCSPINRIGGASLILSLALEDSARRLPPDNIITGIFSLEYKRQTLSLGVAVADFDRSEEPSVSPGGIIVPKTFSGVPFHIYKGMEDRCSFNFRVGRDTFGIPKLQFLNAA